MNVMPREEFVNAAPPLQPSEPANDAQGEESSDRDAKTRASAGPKPSAPTFGSLPSYKPLQFPSYSKDDVARIAGSDQPDRDADSFAGGHFDAVNDEVERAKQHLVWVSPSAEAELAKLKQLHGQNHVTTEIAYVPSAENNVPMGMGIKAKFWTKAGIILIDASLTWLTTAFYLANSGLLKSYSNSVVASSFLTFFVVAAILGGYGFGSSIRSNMIRAIFTKAIIAFGFLTICCVLVPAFSIVFNPASAQSTYSADTVGAGALQAATMDWHTAFALTLAHILGSILLGSGLCLQIDEEVHSFSKKERVHLPEYEDRHAIIERQRSSL